MSESRDAVLGTRFYHQGESSYEDVVQRVADVWSHDGLEAERFYDMMIERRGLPNTPAVANAGRKVQMASACFVLPVNDSLTSGPSSIMQTLMDAAAVHQSGGGTGFNFSNIRPRGSLVSSTGRPAPGPMNVLRLYSEAIGRVTQAGMRPGANMGILNVDHPDIMEFVTGKNDEGLITNFNISVGMTDEFMRDVVNSELHQDERELWDAIIDGAWLNGEPGLIFLDTINRERLHPEAIVATNPCGEVPLKPYEACVLGTVNLAAHVRPTPYSMSLDEIVLKHEMDENALRDTCKTMVRMLDNIIDMQDYPLPIIEQTHKYYRKIGGNPAGLASALILCGYDYASAASLKVQDRWSRIMREACYEASEELADEKGPYPGYVEGMPYRRNLCCMVGAPTGTTSRLLETDFAIEPPMGREVTSFIVDGQFTDRHPLADHPGFFTYHDVSIDDHINVQATWQRHIDQAVSKTLMLPHDATREDVEYAYIRAWKAGCKGVTLLREASREDNVLVSAAPASIAGDCADGKCTI